MSVSAADKVEVEEGLYTIHSRLADHMVLDIDGGSKSSGGNLQLYKWNGSLAQIFWIQKSGDSYTITPMCSGMPLDVKDGTMKSGTNVRQYTSNDSKAQKWKFYSAGGEYYYIACGNFALDVKGGKSSNGTNIQIYKPNSTASQAWRLEKHYTLNETDSFLGRTVYAQTCVVKINSSLIDKSKYQTASIKLNTFKTYSKKEKNDGGKVHVTLKTLDGKTIWSGVKKGGDTIKLGDDNAAYKITVTHYDSGDDFISNAFIDFWENEKATFWKISNPKDCRIYTIN